MSPGEPADGGSPDPTRAELVALGAVTIVAATAAVSLVQAWFGVHDGRIALGVGVLVAVVVGRSQRSRWAACRWSRTDLVALLVVVLALVPFLPGFPYGGKLTDPGIYVLHGSAIARTGSLSVPDPLFDADVDLDTSGAEPRLVTPADTFSVRGRPYRGLSTSSDSIDEFVPSFLHLWPAVLATADDLGGRRGLFAAGPVLGALTLGLLFVGLRRAVGPGAGLVAVGFLAVNLLQVWQVRLPASEVLSQFLYVGAGTALVLALGLRWSAPAALAGATLGLAYLTRADGLYVVLVALAVLATIRVLGRWDAQAGAFLGGLAPVFALGVYQAYGPASGYIRNQRSAPALGLLLGVVVGLAAATWVGGRIARMLEARGQGLGDLLAPGRIQRWLVAGALGALALYLAFSWFRVDLLGEHLRVNRAGELTRDYDEASLRRFVWLVTLPGLLLAAAGLVAATRRLTSQLLVLVPALVLLPVYLWDPRIAPFFMWWGRRFMPLLLPVVAALIGVFAHWALGDARRRRTAVGACVAVALLLTAALEVRALRPVLGHAEFDGSDQAVEAILEIAGPDAVLVWEGGSTSTNLFASVPALRDGRVSIVAPRDATIADLESIATAFGDRPIYFIARPTWFDGVADGVDEVSRVTARISRFDVTFDQLPTGSSTSVADLDVARIGAS